jgi:plastocyanin
MRHPILMTTGVNSREPALSAMPDGMGRVDGSVCQTQTHLRERHGGDHPGSAAIFEPIAVPGRKEGTTTPRVGQRKSLPAILATGLAAVLLASCSSSGGSSPVTSPVSSVPSSSTAGSSAPASSAEKITIDKFAYSGTMTVKAGSKVTVVNNDSAAHTLTDKAHHTFDTGNIPAGGGTGSFTAPTTPGTYKFGCTYHANMAGTLTVTA